MNDSQENMVTNLVSQDTMTECQSLSVRKKIFPDPDLGKVVRQARIKAGLTQAEVGRLIGQNKRAIIRYEQGMVSVAKAREALGACGYILKLKMVKA